MYFLVILSSLSFFFCHTRKMLFLASGKKEAIFDPGYRPDLADCVVHLAKRLVSLVLFFS